MLLFRLLILTGVVTLRSFSFLFAQAPCTNFGRDGIARAPFAHQTSVTDLVIDQQGRWVMTGSYTDDLGMDLFVARFTSDGQPDFSFGKAGFTAVDAGQFGAADMGHVVAIASNGITLVGGGGPSGPRLAAFNLAGNPSSGFGSSGIQVYPGTGPVTSLVVSGTQVYALYPNEGGFSISAISSLGQIITGFGVSGSVVVATPDSVVKDFVGRLIQQPDGKLIAAVVTVSSAPDSNLLRIYRFEADGSLDPTWANNGLWVESEPAPYRVRSLALQTDGSLLVAGDRRDESQGITYPTAHRFSADGMPDFSYNGSGNSVFPATAQMGGAVLGDNDRWYFVGTEINSTETRFLLGAWDNTGVAVSSFGNVPFLPNDPIVEQGQLYGLQRLSDGSFLAWGDITLSNQRTHGLLARLTADGDPIASFARDGYQYLDLVEQSFAVVAKPLFNGKIVSAGTFGTNRFSSGQVAPALARFLPDGQPDSTFGFRGIVSYDLGADILTYFHSLEVLPDGKLIAAGKHNSASEFMAARFLPDGTPDSLFDGDGFAIFKAGCFSCPSDLRKAIRYAQGRYLLAGQVGFVLGSVFKDAGMVMLKGDGTRDSTFGQNGVVRVARSPRDERFNDVAALPDGSILACGGASFFSASTGPKEELFIMKFQPDGDPDLSFGDTSLFIMDMGGLRDDFLFLRVMGSGDIVAAYQTQATIDDSSRRLGLVRLTPDGELDTDFGNQGMVELDVPATEDYRLEGLNVATNGDLLLTGRYKQQLGTSFTFIARYDSLGQLRSDFGTDGVYLQMQPLTTLNGNPLLLEDERMLLPGDIGNYEGYSLICVDVDPDPINIVASSSVMELILFPNPTRSALTVDWSIPLEKRGRLQVIDMQGRIRQVSSLIPGQVSWRGHLHELPIGLYWIRVESEGRQWIGKLGKNE